MRRAGDTLPNELLRYERERRSWTQEEVAERIGASDYNMIGRWERGSSLPAARYRQKLMALFGKSARELGFVRPGEISFWRVPYRQNVFFTGREALLKQIHSALVVQRHDGPNPPLALIGPEGVGKTQVALEYAYRCGSEYHTVAWIRAHSLEALTSDFAALATLFQLPQQHEQNQQCKVHAVQEWLAALTNWLLIFDNVDDLELLRTVLPTPGHILLTTRKFITGVAAEAFKVEAMDPEEGAVFLLRRAKRLSIHSPLSDANEAERVQAKAIVELAGGLPLALDQAGAFIEETECSVANYLDLYLSQRTELLRLLAGK